MTKEEWLNKLKSDQENRNGLGMYVLDTFNETIAELLAQHDLELLSSGDKFYEEDE